MLCLSFSLVSVSVNRFHHTGKSVNKTKSFERQHDNLSAVMLKERCLIILPKKNREKTERVLRKKRRWGEGRGVKKNMPDSDIERKES